MINPENAFGAKARIHLCFGPTDENGEVLRDVQIELDRCCLPPSLSLELRRDPAMEERLRQHLVAVALTDLMRRTLPRRKIAPDTWS